MKILIACEESQAICKAFRELWHEAYSCDILPCSWWHTEWHLQWDVFWFIDQWWDLMIAHPPCTFLSVSGNRHLYNKDWTKNIERWANRRLALDFVQKLMDVDIPRIAIENPISVISSEIKKPTQIIHPWMFWDEASKSTCLWLKNLPKIVATDIVGKWEFFEWVDKNWKKKRQAQWYMDALKTAKSPEERRTLRSKTFPWIAKAIAEQWG